MPISARAFTFEVLTGAPISEKKKHESDEEISDIKPVFLFKLTVFSEKVLIIRPPPRSAPSEMAIDTIKTSETWADVSFVLSLDRKRSIRTATNFCPSCAPCISDESDAPTICSLPYGKDFFLKNKSIKKATKKDTTNEAII